MKIIEDIRLVERRQTRFPRSKKKRIRKKWAGNPHNFTSTPDLNYYVGAGNIIICHPAAAQILRETDKHFFKPSSTAFGRGCWASGLQGVA